MNLFLFLFSSISAGVVVYLLGQAPEGFQSPEGFHLGARVQKSAPSRPRRARRLNETRNPHTLPGVSCRTEAPEYSAP